MVVADSEFVLHVGIGGATRCKACSKTIHFAASAASATRVMFESDEEGDWTLENGLARLAKSGEQVPRFVAHQARCARQPQAAARDRYCYSTDGESFTGDFATREEALGECVGGEDVGPGAATVYTAICRPFTGNEMASRGFQADLAIDEIDQFVCEEIGAEEPFELETTKEQRDELQSAVEATIVAWMERHGIEPTQHRVESVVMHTVTAEEVVEHLAQPEVAR